MKPWLPVRVNPPYDDGVKASVREWVLLAYRLPREPSTPRIAVWRKLERLGAARLLDGLVALPRDARTQEQFEWLAEEIGETGGEATIWFGVPGSRAQQRHLAAVMARRVADDYDDVARSAAEALTAEPAARRRALVKVRRALRAVEARDFFPPPERDRARRAVEDLASRAEVAP
jgi:hypothetical protein